MTGFWSSRNARELKTLISIMGKSDKKKMLQFARMLMNENQNNKGKRRTEVFNWIEENKNLAKAIKSPTRVTPGKWSDKTWKLYQKLVSDGLYSSGSGKSDVIVSFHNWYQEYIYKDSFV